VHNFLKRKTPDVGGISLNFIHYHSMKSLHCELKLVSRLQVVENKRYRSAPALHAVFLQ
jgi:hypothetical protein